MRVLFTGSRHWTNEAQINAKMRELVEEYGASLEIAHGKSKGGGVDAFVEKAADDYGVVQWPFPVRGGKTGVDGANWKTAPLKRNERMVRTFMPDKVIAFRAVGKSNGTDHTIKFAEQFGVTDIEKIEEEL